jgi:hypothetical protein
MQQAIVTDPPESSWQDMQQQAPKEFSTWQALNQFLPGVLDDAKSDDSLVIGKDILLRYHSTIQIASEVD